MDRFLSSLSGQTSPLRDACAISGVGLASVNPGQSDRTGGFQGQTSSPAGRRSNYILDIRRFTVITPISTWGVVHQICTCHALKQRRYVKLTQVMPSLASPRGLVRPQFPKAIKPGRCSIVSGCQEVAVSRRKFKMECFQPAPSCVTVVIPATMRKYRQWAYLTRWGGTGSE